MGAVVSEALSKEIPRGDQKPPDLLSLITLRTDPSPMHSHLPREAQSPGKERQQPPDPWELREMSLGVFFI